MRCPVSRAGSSLASAGTTLVVGLAAFCLSMPPSPKSDPVPHLPPVTPANQPVLSPAKPPVAAALPKPPAPPPTRVRNVTAFVTACSPFDPLDQTYYAKYGYEGRVTRAVAADPRVLPKGTMVRVPGYAGGQWVPVDSKGGSVIRASTRKGVLHFDVKYRTLYSARQWGAQKLTIEIIFPERPHHAREVRDSRIQQRR